MPIEAERLGLTTAGLILRMARLAIDRAEPDEVEVMPRNNSVGKPNRQTRTDRIGQIVPANAEAQRVFARGQGARRELCLAGNASPDLAPPPAAKRNRIAEAAAQTATGVPAANDTAATRIRVARR